MREKSKMIANRSEMEVAIKGNETPVFAIRYIFRLRIPSDAMRATYLKGFIIR